MPSSDQNIQLAKLAVGYCQHTIRSCLHLHLGSACAEAAGQQVHRKLKASQEPEFLCAGLVIAYNVRKVAVLKDRLHLLLDFGIYRFAQNSLRKVVLSSS